MSAPMTARIHPSAHVDAAAELAADVVVGPFAVIGAGVEIGGGTQVGAAAQVYGPTRIGRDNRISPQACIGFDPQDLKFRGEETRLEIGDRNQFRELCTIHRGTAKGGGITRIGNDNLFMVYTHVAHDCRVGDRTIFANNATLAGHVEVQDDASISAFSAVHQFCRVGRHAYIGGYSVITQDALPFVKTVGAKPACYGLNRIGLERKGVPPATIERLEAAVRLLLRSKQPLDEVLASLQAEYGDDPEIAYLADFIETAQRGVIRSLPGRRGARGGG
ncbi:MAG TPA: acyl-ACP--UDP-N-acetylglucosamine O-acyltransferase [Thermoanaerobaculia bacterium]|nr:acyl-ACP--UDP-N-acetylglucosamine O-acyltransferase [Thermoanaerobaculia bacterium]